MRTFLGNGGESKKTRLYLDADCIEIEEEHTVDVMRRRIYLDDVVMVTHSRRFGWQFLANTGIPLFGFVIAAISFIVAGSRWAFIACAFGCIAFLIPFVHRLITRLDVITIFGRRKRAEITFGRRKEFVQNRFDTIVAAVREKMAATQARIEREKPAPVAVDVGPLPEVAAASEVPIAPAFPTVDPATEIHSTPAEVFAEQPTPPPIPASEPYHEAPPSPDTHAL